MRQWRKLSYGTIVGKKKRRAIANKFDKKQRDNLSNNYIKRRLRCNAKLTASESESMPELIEAQRLIIKIKRHAKKIKN
jgi:hypothetical protein